jgi:ParB-like nuclease domain
MNSQWIITFCHISTSRRRGSASRSAMRYFLTLTASTRSTVFFKSALGRARGLLNDNHYPVDAISVLNPRARNRRVFHELITSIAHLGLKKPITVSRRGTEPGYDLVCGQGRLEAFIALGQSEIPAIVIEASQEDCYVMSLVENLARRHPGSLGYLLEHGEERLLVAVERGVMPANIAMEIARAPDGDIQQALAEAYENKLLPGNPNPGHSADHSAAQSAAKEPAAERPSSEHREDHGRGADPEL